MLSHKNVNCFAKVYLPVQMACIRIQTLACCMVMVAFKLVLSWRNINVLNDRSHSTDVIGNVHKIGSRMFGKILPRFELRWRPGRSRSALTHLRRQRKDTHQKPVVMVGHLHSPVKQPGRGFLLEKLSS